MNEKCIPAPVEKDTVENTLVTCMNVLDSTVAVLNNLNIATTGTDSDQYNNWRDQISNPGPGGLLGATKGLLNKANLIFNMAEEIKNSIY